MIKLVDISRNLLRKLNMGEHSTHMKSLSKRYLNQRRGVRLKTDIFWRQGSKSISKTEKKSFRA